jgi:hypothetical protein
MKDRLMIVIYVATLIICFYLIFMTELARKETKTHWGTKSCELAEISPDFTPQEKADCRIARSKAK